MDQLKRLKNQEIIYRVIGLIQKQRDCRCLLINHLVEFDRRQLHIALGYSGLFSYLAQRHKFSESSAYRYTQAVRVVKSFPTVIDDLKIGTISLSNLSIVSKQLLGKNLTFPEKVDLLNRLKGVTKKEVEKIMAPKVKNLPRERVQTLVFHDQKEEKENKFEGKPTPKAVQKTPAEKPSKKVFKKLSFTVKESTYQKLERAKELLSTKYPKGALTSEIFEEALELLLEKKCPLRKEKRREKKPVKKITSQKTTKKVSQNRKYLPAKVKREVFQRSNYSCTYQSEDGKVCGSKHNLHIDHRKPTALGGSDEIENLRILCGVHNLYEAKRIMGEGFVDRKMRGG